MNTLKYSKDFTWIDSLNPHNDATRLVLDIITVLIFIEQV